MNDALRIENLSVTYRAAGRDLAVLRRLTLRIAPGEAYGLAGESGSGKSTAALAAMRYLPPGGRIAGGRILVGGQDIGTLNGEALRRLRASGMAIVYQDPGRALNPAIRAGEQVAEVFRLAGDPPAVAIDRAMQMLQRVRLADPAAVAQRYPHQLSGGMQQRVVIAMALASDPRLLILDEPTTGLDVTVEAEILDMVAAQRRKSGVAVLFISHNLAVLSRVCDRVGILYAGELVEEGPTAEVFASPRHPYTAGLLRCLPAAGVRKSGGRLASIPGLPPPPDALPEGCVFAPRCWLADDRCRAEAPAAVDFPWRLSRCHYPDRAATAPGAAQPAAPAGHAVDRLQRPLLRAVHLSKTFGAGRRGVQALRDVSFDLWPGETLGLVGESGSGKTTLARLLLGLVAPDAGGIVMLDGDRITGSAAGRSADQLKALQIVFQNPDSALNRSQRVRRLIGRTLARLAHVPAPAIAARLLAIMRSVQLADRVLDARPARLSGGQKQRVAIARTFAGEPRIIVCDEPTSALDVSVQASILNLLADLQATRRVSYLFISHDLGTVRFISDRIAVLYLGRMMEIGAAERIFAGPNHPYTASLLAATPTLDRTASPVRLTGDIPSAIEPPSGCAFHTRCSRKLGAICETDEPRLQPGAEPGHAIRCHIPAARLC